MIYKILEIREDLDYGCEERSDTAPLLSEVVLEDKDGGRMVFKTPDSLLVERSLKEGDQVYMDEHETLQKAITSADWTREFADKDLDVSGFWQDMNDLISGTKKKWICPFCGGNILLLKKEGNYSHIACDSCDMYIDLETTLLHAT